MKPTENANLYNVTICKQEHFVYFVYPINKT